MNATRLGLLIAVIGAVLSACGHKAAPAEPAAQAKRVVSVAAITEGPDQPPVVAVGAAANRDEAKLAFKMGGVIRELRVHEGDVIHKGDLLAALETDEVNAGVKQAEEAHNKALRDLERGRGLFAQEVITREQLDDLTTAEAISRAALSGVHYNQGYSRIVAPSDGVVLRRLSEIREQVAPGQPVLVVSSSRQGIVLRVGLPDRDVVKVHKGDKVELGFDALPGQVLPGQVQEVGQAADPRTGTYRVEIELLKKDSTNPQPQNQDANVISGMIGKATIYPAQSGADTRSYVPIEALVEGDQKKAQMYVLDDSGKVHGTSVSIAFIADTRVALNEKIPAGTKVVTSGAAYLHDGEVVEVKE